MICRYMETKVKMMLVNWNGGNFIANSSIWQIVKNTIYKIDHTVGKNTQIDFGHNDNNITLLIRTETDICTYPCILFQTLLRGNRTI